MDDDVVDHLLAEVNQSPIEANRAIATGAAPAALGAGERELRPVHTQLRCKVVEAVFKNALGLAHEPSLHRIADALWAGIVRQAKVQRKARHAGQCAGIGVKLSHALRCTRSACHLARVDHQNHLLTQKWHERAFFPFNLRLRLLGLALLSFFQFAHNPHGFFL